MKLVGIFEYFLSLSLFFKNITVSVAEINGCVGNQDNLNYVCP